MEATELLLHHKCSDGPESVAEHDRKTALGDKRSTNTRSKHLRVTSDSRLFTIGSSRESDLRISGSEVLGCHAVLRCRHGAWYINALGGNVKVDGQRVSEARLSSHSTIEIGHQHVLICTPKPRASLFRDIASQRNESSSAAEPSVSAGTGMSAAGSARLSTRESEMHQVVVKSRGRVIESRTLKRSDVFLTYDGGSKLTLAAPTSHEWVETKLGHRVVLQRLVAAQEVAASAPFRFDRELRRALVVSAIILATMAGLVIELGSHVESKKVTSLDQKSLDMIFSAKTIKRKRSESQKVVVRGARSNSSASANAPAVQSKVAKSSEAPTPSQASVAPQADSKTSAALNSLRKSDLGSLIGKIAKRANRQGVMVAAAGVSPDKENAGHALIGATGSTLGGGGTASKVGATYRLGGVGTQGVGGGVSAGLKNGTGLASGHVGQGDVAALGNDEQTVIEGGLDKDAIAAVIKQNIGQIRYCYERQLSSNRELYGKVLVKWTIGAAGTVREPHIENSTMKSAMVEGCILRRLASWQFPIPRGGTQVRVSYPFLFKALD